MAAAIYNRITNTKDADSAGTCVGSVDVPEGATIEGYFRTSDFFEIMEENGMSIRSNRTKKLLPEMIESANVVISMAEEPFIPDFLRSSEKVVWWEIENPPLATREVSEKMYGQIKSLVKQLALSIEDVADRLT